MWKKGRERRSDGELTARDPIIYIQPGNPQPKPSTLDQTPPSHQNPLTLNPYYATSYCSHCSQTHQTTPIMHRLRPLHQSHCSNTFQPLSVTQPHAATINLIVPTRFSPYQSHSPTPPPSILLFLHVSASIRITARSNS